MRKTEELRKAKKEKKVLEVVISLRKELKMVEASFQLKEPPKKREVIEVGVQVVSTIISASSEPDLQVMKDDEELKEEEGANKGREREEEQRLLLSQEVQEYTVMQEIDRFSLYGYLSEYEKEVEEDWKASPALQKPKKPAGKTLHTSQTQPSCESNHRSWHASSGGARNLLQSTHFRHHTGHKEDRNEGYLMAPRGT